MDALRSIKKSNGYSFKVFLDFVLNICNQSVELDRLKEPTEKVKNSIEKIASLINSNPEILQIGARDFSFSLYRVFTGNSKVNLS